MLLNIYRMVKLLHNKQKNENKTANISGIFLQINVSFGQTKEQTIA